METVVISCCGKYLEDSGIDSALVGNEIYGPNSVKSVMDGGNYIRDKPAKSQSGIIGFSRRKGAVCKWNIIKHERSNYISFLRHWCSVNENDEYSLHHEFSKSITEADETCVSQITEYIRERFNPFSTEGESEIVNIVTKTF